MRNIPQSPAVIENVGAIDRIVRAILGALLLAVVFTLAAQSYVLGWHAVLSLVAVYPLLTAIVGFDPFYALWGAKTCSTDGANQCGTFPYEVASLAGKAPPCAASYDCSLETAVQSAQRRSVA